MGPDTAVLSIQNGMENDILAQLYGADSVLGGVIYIEANLVAPGHIVQPTSKRELVFGEWQGGLTPRAHRIRRLFEGTGLDTRLVEDVQPALWRKYIFICAFSGMTALTRSHDCPDAITDWPDSRLTACLGAVPAGGD